MNQPAGSHKSIISISVSCSQEELEKLLVVFLNPSPDPNALKAAQLYMDQFWFDTYPSELFINLALIGVTPSKQSSSLAFILLRRYARKIQSREKKFTFSLLPVHIQSRVKEILLPSVFHSKAACDAAAEIAAAGSIPWTSLLDSVMECLNQGMASRDALEQTQNPTDNEYHNSNSSSSSKVVLAIRLLGMLSEMPIFHYPSSPTGALGHNGFYAIPERESRNISDKMLHASIAYLYADTLVILEATLIAVSKIIISLVERSLIKKKDPLLKTILPLLWNGMVKMMNGSLDPTECITSVMELAEKVPSSFLFVIPDLVAGISRLSDHNLSSPSTIVPLLIEFFITLVENTTKMVLFQYEESVYQFLVLLFHFSIRSIVEEDNDWENDPDSLSGVDEEESALLAVVAENALDRFATAIGQYISAAPLDQSDGPIDGNDDHIIKQNASPDKLINRSRSSSGPTDKKRETLSKKSHNVGLFLLSNVAEMVRGSSNGELYTGLRLLSVLSEGLNIILEGKEGEVISLLWTIHSKNPRNAKVNWALTHVIGQLANDLPAITRQGQPLLRILYDIIQLNQDRTGGSPSLYGESGQSISRPRVRMHAIAVMINWSAGIEADGMPETSIVFLQTTFVEIFPSLVAMVSDPRPWVIRQALATLSVLFDFFTMNLSNEVDGTLNETNQLKVKASMSLDGSIALTDRLLESQAGVKLINVILTLLNDSIHPACGVAVELAAILGNMSLMDALIDLQSRVCGEFRLLNSENVSNEGDRFTKTIDGGEVITSSVQREVVQSLGNAWARLAPKLGNRLLVIMPFVISMLLNGICMNKDQFISFVDDGVDSLDGWDYVSVRGKRLGIHTSGLEELAETFITLSTLFQAVSTVLHPPNSKRGSGTNTKSNILNENMFLDTDELAQLKVLRESILGFVGFPFDERVGMEAAKAYIALLSLYCPQERIETWKTELVPSLLSTISHVISFDISRPSINDLIAIDSCDQDTVDELVQWITLLSESIEHLGIPDHTLNQQGSTNDSVEYLEGLEDTLIEILNQVFDVVLPVLRYLFPECKWGSIHLSPESSLGHGGDTTGKIHSLDSNSSQLDNTGWDEDEDTFDNQMRTDIVEAIVTLWPAILNSAKEKFSLQHLVGSTNISQLMALFSFLLNSDDLMVEALSFWNNLILYTHPPCCSCHLHHDSAYGVGASNQERSYPSQDTEFHVQACPTSLMINGLCGMFLGQMTAILSAPVVSDVNIHFDVLEASAYGVGIVAKKWSRYSEELRQFIIHNTLPHLVMLVQHGCADTHQNASTFTSRQRVCSRSAWENCVAAICRIYLTYPDNHNLLPLIISSLPIYREESVFECVYGETLIPILTLPIENIIHLPIGQLFLISLQSLCVLKEHLFSDLFERMFNQIKTMLMPRLSLEILYSIWPVLTEKERTIASQLGISL